MDSNSNSSVPKSKRHLLLKPEEVGWVDILKAIFSWNLKRSNKLVEVKGGGGEEWKRYLLHNDPYTRPKGVSEESFYFRLSLIIMSTLLQKFLILMAKPYSAYGSLLHHLSNLFSTTRNVILRFCNFLRG